MTVKADTPISAKVIEVIIVKAGRGTGTVEDPFRIVRQYWSLEGDLLAEDDIIKELPDAGRS